MKESQSPRVKSPNPTHRRIRIFRAPLGRWIDPDPLGSRSNGSRHGRSGPGQDRPDPHACIKGVGSGSLSFSSNVSLSSSFSLLLSAVPHQTLTLVLPKSTQKHTTHALNHSYYWFKRESIARTKIKRQDQCEFVDLSL